LFSSCRGASTIQGHPRQIQTTVRREENPRKEARERRKARKAEEIAKKTEEVNRLKALRMREIRRKLYLVEKESGLKEEGAGKVHCVRGILDSDFRALLLDLQELDLDGEWEASKHDTQMAALYAEDQDLDNEVCVCSDALALPHHPSSIPG
jgi:protein KRI1